ncbi:MAG TPA: ammonium transporter, partial [Rhodobiaceae bacterium]|nr:ammonium transporter [Rhodobiaceae bacterium]
MSKTGRYTKMAGMAGLAVLAMSAPAFAQEAEEAFTLSAPETAYIFNTLLFLIGGFLVMWMAAGFA